MTAAVPAGHAIRRAGPADAVRALTRLAYAKWVPLVGREPTPATADYERIVREDPVDLLLHDGELVALACGPAMRSTARSRSGAASRCT